MFIKYYVMKWIYYTILLLTNQFIYGMLGAYSIAKKDIQNEFEFNEDIFGNFNFI